MTSVMGFVLKQITNGYKGLYIASINTSFEPYQTTEIYGNTLFLNFRLAISRKNAPFFEKKGAKLEV